MTQAAKMDFKKLQALLPQRARDSHKGDYGTVLVIGGAPGMMGAPLLAAMAAQRVGAGKVIIATDPQHAAMMVVNEPSLMAYGVANAIALQPLLEQATHIVMGPGLGQSDWAQALFTAVLNTRLPMVVDADALNLLSQQAIARSHWILTPHMGEAARLLNTSTNEIQANREAAIQALQKKYDGVIVLKGAHTLVATASELQVCEAGNPGMATAGMGDILSGVIAGLAAQTLSLPHAAQLGVAAHAFAGDLAAGLEMRGLIPTDLLRHLRTLVNP